MSGYSLRSKSNYAKYLEIDSYKQMSNMGYGYLSMNICGNVTAEKTDENNQ